jgi:hypothetical protein
LHNARLCYRRNVVRAGLFSAAPCALCLVTIGCVFTDPINVAPEIKNVTGPMNLVRGEVARYAVDTVDGDGGKLTIEWARTVGDCPQAKGAWPDESVVEGNTFNPGKTDLGRFCVWVKAIDQYGAFDVANLQIQVDNQPPTVRLIPETLSLATVPAAHELFTQFRIRGEIEDDDGAESFTGDRVSFTLTRPDGTTTSDVRCEDTVGARSACFLADVPGRWTLGLAATDPHGKSAMAAPLTFEVKPDRLPCILAVRPRFDPKVPVPVSPLDTVQIEISVDDDGDPLPARDRPSSASLTWRYKLPGSTTFERLPEINRNPFTLPNNYFRTGDEVEVQAEVRDRNNVDVAESTCMDGGRFCAASPGCPQRITWRLWYAL